MNKLVYVNDHLRFEGEISIKYNKEKQTHSFKVENYETPEPTEHIAQVWKEINGVVKNTGMTKVHKLYPDNLVDCARNNKPVEVVVIRKYAPPHVFQGFILEADDKNFQFVGKLQNGI